MNGAPLVRVYALTVYDNKLIAGGGFTTAGGKVSAYVAAWDKCDCTGFCDVDRDGNLAMTDIVRVVNFVYRNSDSRKQIPGCSGNNGDWNCDGVINGVDVVLYVNYLLRMTGTPPCDPCATE